MYSRWMCCGSEIFSRKCNTIQKILISMLKLFFVQDIEHNCPYYHLLLLNNTFYV